ncbi:MAG: hypothetical protein V4437_00900 [Patescibacteria group bacterium]
MLGVLIVGGIGYVALKPQMTQNAQESVAANTNTSANTNTTPSQENRIKEPVISWKFEAAAEKDNVPYTNVSVTVNGTAHAVGSFQGSCSQVGASGGVDGKGLLAGELSAAQCWFAGGGDEVGVFATEDGGLEVMTGVLSEGEEGAGVVRGNFTIETAYKL